MEGIYPNIIIRPPPHPLALVRVCDVLEMDKNEQNQRQRNKREIW